MLLLPGKNEETHPLKNREHPKYFRNVYGVMYHVPCTNIIRTREKSHKTSVVTCGLRFLLLLGFSLVDDLK